MKKDCFLVGTTVLCGFLLAAGCSLINAPSDVNVGATGGSGGGSPASSSSDASSSSSGNVGGGGGAGGATACQPGNQMPCYDGTAGTDGIGECHSGFVTCLMDGSGYGPCEGQVVDAPVDNCATPLFDENCDGVENDNCPGERLIIVAAAPTGYPEEVRDYLMATGKFEAVNIFDAGVGTPALADLQTYQAALVFSDKILSNPTALGDALGDYYDLGGRVVLALFATNGMGTRVLGKFGDPSMGYMITDPTAGLSTPTDDALGTILEPQSRLLRDVSSFTYTGSTKSTGGPINGGTVVAQWGNGDPLIIRGTVLGRNRVDVNFYPPQTQMGSTAWLGDGAAILRNAVLY